MKTGASPLATFSKKCVGSELKAEIPNLKISNLKNHCKHEHFDHNRICYNRYMIRIYTTETCVYCHALMEWLDEQGIKYEERSANEDPTISSVPVTRIDMPDGSTKEILGFDRPALKKVLKELAV